MRLLAILLAAEALAIAQTAPNAVPMPNPEVQYLDSTGAPLVGAKLCTYTAGTTTPLATYTDASAATANSNPIILDSSGRASVWLGFQLYKFILKNGGDSTCSTGSVLWTQDNVGVVSPGIVNALRVIETSSGSTGSGGYIQLSPVSYPNSSCFDMYGNPVNIPQPLPGFPSFGTNDVIIWESQSPLAGVNPSNCATPLPTLNNSYGLNINTYIIAQGGFATWLNSYAAFTAWYGGFTGNNFLAGVLYPTGTVTSTGTLSVPTYLGGHIAVGHSVGPPAVGTIATVTNPLSGNEGLVQGDLYFDDALGCFNGYNGSTWSCLGGQTAGGTVNAIQINGGGGFTGSANFAYNPATGNVVLTDGSMTASGGFAATGVATNIIQAPYGGVTGKWVTASDSMFWLAESAPALSGTNQARIYLDSSSLQLMASINGAAYTALGSGGSGSVAAEPQYEIAYYTASGTGTAIGGNAAFTVAGGAINSSGGFVTTSTSTAAIQAPNGTITGKYVTAANSEYFVEVSAPSVSLSGQAALYADSTAHKIAISENGGGFFPVATYSGTLTNGHCVSINSGGQFVDAGGACTTGGGGGTVAAAPQYELAYYTTSGSSTVVGGSTAFIVNVANGYISTTGGFVTTSTSTAAIQAPNGTVLGEYLTATNSMYFVEVSPPAVSQTGQAVLYADSSSNTLKLSINGGAYATVGAGGSGSGITSINTLTGPAITLVQTSNQVLISGSGSSITFSLPQSIATSSSPTFAGLTLTGSCSGCYTAGTGVTISGGAISIGQAVATSSAVTFNSATITSQLAVNYSGSGAGLSVPNSYVQSVGFNATGTAWNEIQSAGAINSTGGYYVGGTQAIDSSRNGNFGTGIFSGAITANSGIATSAASNSLIYIGSGGAFYDISFSGGDASCGGVGNGWMGIRMDGGPGVGPAIEVCVNGSLKRAILQ